MTWKERYQKEGWALVRELLLLREKGVEVSGPLDSLVDDPPPFPDERWDPRFEELAQEVVARWVTEDKVESARWAKALSVITAWREGRVEERVREVRAEFGCTIEVARIYLEAERREGGSLSVLLAILSGINKGGAALAQGGSQLLNDLARLISANVESEGPPARETLLAANKLARGFGHPVTGSDHLLLALYDGPAGSLLTEAGLSRERALELLWRGSVREMQEVKGQGWSRTLSGALWETAHHSSLSLLKAILESPDSAAARILLDQKVNITRLVATLATFEQECEEWEPLLEDAQRVMTVWETGGLQGKVGTGEVLLAMLESAEDYKASLLLRKLEIDSDAARTLVESERED